MKVKKSEVVQLFDTLGVPDTAGLPPEKFAAKITRMAKYTPEEGAASINPVAAGALFEKIIAANTAGETVEVEDDGVKKKTPAKAAKPEPAAKKGAKKKAVKTDEPAPKKKGKKKVGRPRDPNATGGWTPESGPLAFAEGGSVIKTIVDILKAAGEKGKPVTKEAIHEKMKKAFPDRDHAKMFTTMSNQVPSRLRIVRGIHVWKTQVKQGDVMATAYWIEGTGAKAQPETKSEKKEVNKKKADDGKTDAEVAAAASKKKGKKPVEE